MIPPVGALGSGAELGISQLEGAGSSTHGAEVGASQGAEGASFGSELTDAISSLEKTQESGDSASQALATGSVKDPESAVVTVEDAQMAMDLASQVRNKVTEAAQNIFQTQV